MNVSNDYKYLKVIFTYYQIGWFSREVLIAEIKSWQEKGAKR